MASPAATPIQVIAPTDLSVYAGEILAVLGPSGSGKSTLLRMLTGLSTPSAGEVLWHGKPVTGQSPNVSIVFQSFALFPWLTVLENVEAPLKARGIGEIPRSKRSLSRADRWRIVILPGMFPYLVTSLITASGGAWNASIFSFQGFRHADRRTRRANQRGHGCRPLRYFADGNDRDGDLGGLH
ncbi:MAG TPA: ATP-binding cassette domain-containing protein [Bryobacteraceae bacterium]|jgi:ABC-type sugar transport system ATPase subunit